MLAVATLTAPLSAPRIGGCLVSQVGDGTTSVVLLAGEILKHIKGFVEDGLHPQVRSLMVLFC